MLPKVAQNAKIRIALQNSFTEPNTESSSVEKRHWNVTKKHWILFGIIERSCKWRKRSAGSAEIWEHGINSRPLLTFPILSWFTRLPNDTFSDVPFLYLCCFLVGSGGLHAWLVSGLSGLSFVHLIAPCQERHQATLRDPDNKSMKRTQWLLHALAALTPLTSARRLEKKSLWWRRWWWSKW